MDANTENENGHEIDLVPTEGLYRARRVLNQQLYDICEQFEREVGLSIDSIEIFRDDRGNIHEILTTIMLRN